MFRNVLCSISALTLIFAAPDSAFAQKKLANPDQASVSGVVKKIDDKSITIAVVTQKGQPAEEKSFALAADAKVSVLGKEAKIAEVIVDKPASLTLNAEKKVVAVAQDKVGDKAHGLSGTFKKFDDKANTVTVAIVTQKGQPAEDQTFTLAANVKISVLGNAAKLSDIAADKPVQLKLDTDKKVAVITQDKTSEKGDKGAGVSGMFKKFDATANTVTVAIVTQKGQPAAEQTFKVTADAKVSVLGNAAKLSDVVADKQVQLKLDADKNVVALVQVDKTSGSINGVLKKIDDKAGTLTIAVVKVKGQPAEEQTFNVIADSRIIVSGKPAKLGELDLEKPVSLTLNADKKVATIAQGKGEKPMK